MLFPWKISVSFKMSIKNQKKKNLRKRKNLINKFINNQKRRYEFGEKSTNYVKEPILNLTNEEIPGSYRSLLNHEPKFVPTCNKISIMGIIASESCALEKKEKTIRAETIQQNEGTTGLDRNNM